MSDATPRGLAPDDAPMPLLAHLSELRRTLCAMLAIWFFCSCAMAALSPFLLDLLRDPNGVERGVSLLAARPLDGFSIVLAFAFWGGLAAATPVWSVLAMRFVSPGLTTGERRYAVGMVAAGFSLFALGVFGGYRWMLPAALDALGAVNRWLGADDGVWLLPEYVSFALKVLLASGVSLEFPLLLLVLLWLGVLDVQQLRHYRRHAVIVILVVAMFLTPPDPVTQLLMAVPMYLLYELCILIAPRRRVAGHRHD